LLETVVATAVIVTALAGLAQLVAASAGLTRTGVESGLALVAAQQKLESLRALDYAYDDAGLPTGDTRLAPGRYEDRLDASGLEVGEGAPAAFARRWRITALHENEPTVIAIEVCVFTIPVRDDGACLATVRARQP
jgi:hypothetical protein